MVNRLSWAAFLATGLLGAPSAWASYEPEIALRLDYQALAGEGCPSADELGRMIQSEFGYEVIREDAQGVLRIEVLQQANGSFAALLTGLDASGSGELWSGRTDLQPTCRELAYDIGVLVKAHMGSQVWPNGQPPEELRAPLAVKDISSTLHPYPLRPYSSLLAQEEERLLRKVSRSDEYEETPERLARRRKYEAQAEERYRRIRQEEWVRVMVGVGPAGLAYGLPSFGVGGGGILSFRWPRFALTADVRGVITPVAGIGAENLPVRTSMWSGTVLPCARAKFLDICAAVSVGRVAFHLEDDGILRSTEGVVAGFGARISAGWKIKDGYSLLAYGDLMADHRSMVFSTTNSSDEVTQIWRSPPVRIGLGLMLGFDLTE